MGGRVFKKIVFRKDDGGIFSLVKIFRNKIDRFSTVGKIINRQLIKYRAKKQGIGRYSF